LRRSPAPRLVLAILLVLGLSFAAFAGTAVAASQPFEWTVAKVVPPPTTLNLYKVVALSSTNIWAVGYKNSPLPVDGRVYHFDGNSWTMSLSVGAQRMWSITALDSTHVWASGEAGKMRFFNGTIWSNQDLPTGANVNSVTALDTSHVWAIDDASNIFFYNGTSWSAPVTPLPGHPLQSVFALDINHVWAVGNNGTILFWNGSTWVDQSVGGANTLWSVTALDSNYAWAVGQAGTVLYWNGTAWTNTAPGITDLLTSVCALDVNHVFAAGNGGRMYFFDGTAWQMAQTTSTSQLWGVTALDTDHVYAVGEQSDFLHGYSVMEAQNSTFYFAEGTCRPTFDPYICIQNPDENIQAQVTITYMLGNGTNVPQTFAVAPSSRTTVAVKGVLGSGDDAAHDFSAKVVCTNDLPIIAERPMYFSYRSSLGVVETGGSDVVGALQPRPSFYFAEGTCRPNFDPYICVQNPGAVQSNVNITYMLGNGLTQTQSLVVPGHTRKTIAVKDKLGSGNDVAHDFSARVTTTDGTSIVAERPMYFSYISSQGVQITGGHDVVGAATPAKAFYFAEGTCRPNFDPYICIQNPGPSPAVVKITYMLGSGTTQQQLLTVPVNTRQTVSVKGTLGSADDAAHDFSAKVETTNGTNIVAERPMYFNYRSSLGVMITGGHDVVGALYPAASYFFAEGTCRPNFDPYLCIQNPGAVPVTVTITYMKGAGDPVTQAVTVAANSRYTVNVKAQLGSGDDAAHDFSVRVLTASLAFDDIIVERPMYFNYRSTMGVFLTGGHDVVGYSP